MNRKLFILTQVNKTMEFKEMTDGLFSIYHRSPEKPRSIEEIEKNRKSIISDLERSNFQESDIGRYLDNNRALLTGILLLETKDKKINLGDEKGKRIWNNVFHYYNERGLNKDLPFVKFFLYEYSFPIKNQLIKYFSAIIGGATFGIIGWDYIQDSMINKRLEELLHNN